MRPSLRRATLQQRTDEVLSLLGRALGPLRVAEIARLLGHDQAYTKSIVGILCGRLLVEEIEGPNNSKEYQLINN